MSLLQNTFYFEHLFEFASEILPKEKVQKLTVENIEKEIEKELEWDCDTQGHEFETVEGVMNYDEASEEVQCKHCHKVISPKEYYYED